MESLTELKLQRDRALNKLRENPIRVRYNGFFFVILDSTKGHLLYKIAYFGNPLGIRKPKIDTQYNTPYILSIYETLYLHKRKVIFIEDWDDKQNSDVEGFIRMLGNKEITDFEYKYLVYEDLRERGYVVRPGMKFGSDFAVYIYGPGIDHAPFLVTVYSKNRILLGIDLIRAGRLASSVRKKWVIATVEEDSKIRYYVFSWFKT